MSRVLIVASLLSLWGCTTSPAQGPVQADNDVMLDFSQLIKLVQTGDVTHRTLWQFAYAARDPTQTEAVLETLEAAIESNSRSFELARDDRLGRHSGGDDGFGCALSHIAFHDRETDHDP